MSTIDRVLQRLPYARRVGGGWSARCPAHEDRAPSLSIREGRKGILLHCFAGCTLAEITAALGVSIADLFNKGLHAPTLTTRPQQSFTVDEVEDSLRANLRLIIDAEAARIGYRPPITSRHHNAARQTASCLFSVSITPAVAAWWECPPHDADPLWLVFAARALLEIAEWERGHDTPTQEDRNDALDRAAEWIRYEARRDLMLAKAGKAA